MPKVKSTTIRLTPAQRAKIRELTGQDHASVKFEVTPGKGGSVLAAKTALTQRFAPGKGKLPQPWTPE